VNTVDQNMDALDLGASMRVELGMLLRQARLKQQKEIGDVAKRLILSPSQVLNLEAGTMDSFHHERRYVHALKGYLFYLGLSRDLIINDKLQQLETASLQAVSSSASGVARLYKAGHGPAPVDAKTQKQRIFIGAGTVAAIFGIVVFALIVGGGWLSGSENSEAEQALVSDADKTVATAGSASQDAAVSTASPSAQAAQAAAVAATSTGADGKVPELSATTASPALAPTSNQAPTPAPTPVATVSSVAIDKPATGANSDPFENLKSTTLRIVFVGECWASLITTDGRRNERIFQAGQSIDVELDRVASLTIGNSPQARLQVGSKPLDVAQSGAVAGNVARLNQAILQKLAKQ
jgi:cytoskeletal protein RodZ